jgi:hypothetical protein
MKNRKRKYRCVKRPEIEDKEPSSDSLVVFGLNKVKYKLKIDIKEI